MSTFPDRRWLVIPAEEVPNINFAQVVEAGPDSLRYSVDGTKTFVKWESAEPTFLADLETKSDLYTYEEILAILQTPEWTAPMDMPTP